MSPADRLAALVDPEVLSAVLDHLEHLRRVGGGGQVRWHVDGNGLVESVECQGFLYRRRNKERERLKT